MLNIFWAKKLKRRSKDSIQNKGFQAQIMFIIKPFSGSFCKKNIEQF